MGFSIHGIFQARVLELGNIAFSDLGSEKKEMAILVVVSHWSLPSSRTWVSVCAQRFVPFFFFFLILLRSKMQKRNSLRKKYEGYLFWSFGPIWWFQVWLNQILLPLLVRMVGSVRGPLFLRWFFSEEVLLRRLFRGDYSEAVSIPPLSAPFLDFVYLFCFLFSFLIDGELLFNVKPLFQTSCDMLKVNIFF